MSRQKFRANLLAANYFFASTRARVAAGRVSHAVRSTSRGVRSRIVIRYCDGLFWIRLGGLAQQPAQALLHHVVVARQQHLGDALDIAEVLVLARAVDEAYGGGALMPSACVLLLAQRGGRDRNAASAAIIGPMR